jgi:microcystin degradation protein MlrC
MRIGLAWISQETSTFNRALTPVDHFAAFGIYRGAEVIEHLGDVGCVGGYMKAAGERDDVTTVPIFSARSGASGRLSTETLEFLAGELDRGLAGAGPLDGLALQLHGACSAVGVDDVDGHLLAIARRRVGSDVPIVLALDHHANLTAAMVDGSDALVAPLTQPHDPFETGYLGARLLFRIVDGDATPTTAWRKIPLISHQEQFLTSQGPMKEWFDRSRAIEAADDRVLQISNFPMQPWLDVDEGGWAVAVVTNDDRELAERIADELAGLAWELRDRFQARTSISVADAVRRANDARDGVVVLSDTGDSVLGGAGGDSTLLIREMLAQGITGPALVPLVHPAIGELLDSAQVGDVVTVEVGGAVAQMHDAVSLTGRLAYLAPTVVHLSGGYGIPMADLGMTAVLEVPFGVVVITQRHGIGGVHPEMYEQLGIDPTTFKMAVVKTASNFQWFAPLTSEVIRVDTVGPTQSDIEALPWERIPRPVYPLDPIDSWR